MLKRVLFLAAAAVFLLAGAAAAGTDDVLRVGVQLDAKNMDPHNSVDTYSFSIQKQMYEALVSYDSKTKKLVPALAESWEILDDTTYKFNLRKGVKFHNGEELTADDVLFSLTRVTTPDSMYNGSKGKYIDPNGFKVVDKYTIIVKTNGPSGGFLESMKHPYAFILNRKAVEAAGKDYSKAPVGTGPYMLENWVKGERITLKRFDDYHGKKGNFAKMDFLILPDNSSRMIALETDKIDFLYGVPFNEVERLRKDGKVQVVETPGSVLMHIGMNMRSKKLKDPNARLAIEYAVNKVAFNQVVYRNHAVVPQGPLVPATSWYPANPKGYDYDLAKAKDLLKKGGLKEGDKLTLLIMNVQERVDSATLLQAMLSQLGIQVEIKVLETAIFEQTLQKGNDDMYIGTWGIQTCPDASVYWQALFTKEAVGTTNKTFTEDDELDRLVREASATVDPAKKPAIFQKTWDEINKVHPMVYLSVPNEVHGASKKLAGVEDLLDGKINYLGNLSFAKQ